MNGYAHNKLTDELIISSFIQEYDRSVSGLFLLELSSLADVLLNSNDVQKDVQRNLLNLDFHINKIKSMLQNDERLLIIHQRLKILK